MLSIKKEEWKKLYPIKKVIILFLWLFLILIIYASLLAIVRDHEIKAIFVTVLATVGAIKTYHPVKNYVLTPYHCMPFFNCLFSKKELEKLLDGEEFKQMSGDIKYAIDTPLLKESENWLCIDGRFVSKKMAIIARAWVAASLNNRDTTSVKIFYMTGDYIEIKTGSSWPVKRIEAFNHLLWGKYNIVPAKVFSRNYATLTNAFKKVSENIKQKQGLDEKGQIYYFLETDSELKELFWSEIPGFKKPENTK